MRWKETEISGWGRVLSATQRLARPERNASLSDVLADTPCPAIGNLRSYGDAPLNAGGHGIDMTRLDRVLGFDPDTGVLEAEAGITISQMLEIFAPQGWMPAVMPGTGFATLGGCIANDVHGKNHHIAGTFGNHVVSVVLIGADGKATSASPKRNKALFAATLGGLGQTGVIKSAKIQLSPCTSRLIQVDERRAPDLETFMDMLAQSKATYSVGWIDGTAKGAALGRGILEEAELTSSNMQPRLRKSRAVPMNAPSFALSPPTVRAFNAAYYRRIPDDGRGVLRALGDFFFPLDKIHNWNRLYGKRGFHQFQCVLPDGTAADTLRSMLTLISEAGSASPLAVIKRTGPGRAGPLSFPMQGYTLALDFPNTPRARGLVSKLNQMTQAAGGRIYFAKDSLATPEQAAAMYPELDDWRATVALADTKGDFETDLTRRLKLRGTE